MMLLQKNCQDEEISTRITSSTKNFLKNWIAKPKVTGGQILGGSFEHDMGDIFIQKADEEIKVLHVC